MTKHSNTAALVAVALLGGQAMADTIVTKNGSTITGDIVRVDQGEVTVETGFAGTLFIKQSEIESISTDEPIYLSVNDGSTYLGPVTSDDDAIAVNTDDGLITTDVGSIEEVWLPGGKSPSLIRHELALAELERNWSYEAAFDFTGKTGNTSSTGLATSFRALLDGPHDELLFFASANYEETGESISANDTRGGVDYTNKIGSGVNWYVRSEIGRDEVKAIDLFVTAAGGFGYYFWDTERRKLNVRSGLGYLYEAYADTPILNSDGEVIGYEPVEATSSASLDLGLLHEESFKWGKLTNRLTFTPTLQDMGNYRLLQDTNLNIPLKLEDWSVRIGVANRIDSEAEQSEKEELDTTYYLRMVLSWD